MSEIAVAVRDPQGKRFAQLLHDDLPVREVVLILANRLELPTKLNYELFLYGLDQALEPGRSLAAAGIGAGADLLLKPIKDKVFDAFIQGLQNEIKSELKGEAKKRAKDLLGKLLTGGAAAEGVKAAAGAASQAAASEAAADAAATAPPPPAADPQRAAAQPKPAKGRSCLRTGCISLVVLTLAAAAGAALVYDDYVKPLVSQIAEGMGVHVAGLEPVLGTGDVQVTLRWDNPVDLDLHVVDPAGEEIWFLNPSSASGGTLDVDANGQCTGDVPVENVFWPTGAAPHGNFDIYVVYYQECGYTGASAYTVSILVDGVTYGPFTGVFSGSSGEEHYITTITR